jgi:methyl-accepting chemotaxis protein
MVAGVDAKASRSTRIYGAQSAMSGFMSRFSVRAKLIASFGLMLLVTGCLGAFAVQRMGAMNESTEVVIANYFPSIVQAGEMRSIVQQIRLREARHILSTDPTEMQAVEKQMTDLSVAYSKARKNFDAIMDVGEETELYKRIDGLWAQYSELRGPMLAASRKNENETAAALWKDQLSDAFGALSALFDQDVEYNRVHGLAAGADGKTVYQGTITATYLVVGFAALITLLLGLTMVRGISGPIGKMTTAMRRLADRDMTTEIPGIARGDEIGRMARAVQVFKDNGLKEVSLEAEIAANRAAAEFERARIEAKRVREAAEDQVAITALAHGLDALANGNLTYQITEDVAPKTQQLKDDFNVTAARLRETIGTIADAIQGMTNGTGEISQAADDLSRRTEQQAASLEQTAAALDQITATVRKTAEGATHVQAVVSTAKSDAEQSSGVVREAVVAMTEIKKSSEEVSQIIGVIDEIAFQTNLLALNAGVEAARAGDAGRGFAVVASEVRGLAQRSAQAAKEIKQLISTSSQQVGRGVKLVNETGDLLHRIVGHVAEVYTAITEIAASAKEQASGLHEVNVAVNQMDQVTQQNAAMVEQSTAATHSLSQETAELLRLTGHFQINAVQSGLVASASAQPLHRSTKPGSRPTKAAALKLVTRSGGAAVRKPALIPESAGESWTEF